MKINQFQSTLAPQVKMFVETRLFVFLEFRIGLAISTCRRFLYSIIFHAFFQVSPLVHVSPDNFFLPANLPILFPQYDQNACD